VIIAASILLCAAAIWDAGSVAARPGKILEISIFESRHSYPEVNIIRLYDTGRYTIGPPRYERRGVIDFKRYAGQVSELPMSRTPIAFKTIGFGYLIDVRDSRGKLNAAVSESGDRDQRLLAFVRSVEAAIASEYCSAGRAANKCSTEFAEPKLNFIDRSGRPATAISRDF
jgi:hypothetical protein